MLPAPFCLFYIHNKAPTYAIEAISLVTWPAATIIRTNSVDAVSTQRMAQVF